MVSVLKKKPMPVELETARLILRKHSEDLAAMLFAAIDNDRENLSVFLPWVQLTRTVQDELNYIKNARSQWAKCEGFDYGLYLRDTDQFVGNVSVHSISWHNQRAEIGYWLHGNFEGQGYMTEAVDQIVQETFALGFHRVEIRCDGENKRSAGVPKRLGFRHEATLEDEAIVNGRFRNTLVFSMLRSRYQPLV